MTELSDSGQENGVEGGGGDGGDGGSGRRGGSTGEDAGPPGRFIERALIESHHLANLTGLDEAKLARKRLVSAQSATSEAKVRDLLHDAIEFLELARMERRDAAAGFAKAKRYAIYAESELSHEDHVQSFSVERLFDDTLVHSTHRQSLEDLRMESRVGSYEELTYEMALEESFQDLRREVVGADGDGAGRPYDEEPEELTIEEALRLANVELTLERQNQQPLEREGGFDFLTDEKLVSAEK